MASVRFGFYFVLGRRRPDSLLAFDFVRARSLVWAQAPSLAQLLFSLQYLLLRWL